MSAERREGAQRRRRRRAQRKRAKVIIQWRCTLCFCFLFIMMNACTSSPSSRQPRPARWARSGRPRPAFVTRRHKRQQAPPCPTGCPCGSPSCGRLQRTGTSSPRRWPPWASSAGRRRRCSQTSLCSREGRRSALVFGPSQMGEKGGDCESDGLSKERNVQTPTSRQHSPPSTPAPT
jgi:hypothetical protein